MRTCEVETEQGKKKNKTKQNSAVPFEFENVFLIGPVRRIPHTQQAVQVELLLCNNKLL